MSIFSGTSSGISSWDFDFDFLFRSRDRSPFYDVVAWSSTVRAETVEHQFVLPGWSSVRIGEARAAEDAALAAWTLIRGGFAGRGWGLLHRPGAAKHEESSWLSVRLLLLRDLRRGRETA
jgi:hypothetical protein